MIAKGLSVLGVLAMVAGALVIGFGVVQALTGSGRLLQSGGSFVTSLVGGGPVIVGGFVLLAFGHVVELLEEVEIHLRVLRRED